MSVSGSAKEPNYVSQKVTEFLEEHQKDLDSLTQKTFDEIKKSLEINSTQKPLTLSEDADRIWAQIHKHRYEWEYIEVFKKQLAKIALEDVRKVYKKIFIDDLKILEVHIISHNLKDHHKEGLKNREYKNIKKIQPTQNGYPKLRDKFSITNM